MPSSDSPAVSVNSVALEPKPLTPSDTRLALSPADSPNPLDLAALPLWQRRYCSAIAAGLTDVEAEAAANIVHSTLAVWTQPGHPKYDPVFARAEQAARNGVAMLSREAVRADTLAQAAIVTGDAFRESRDPTTRGQDRIGNRRLVLESAGVIGAQAQQASVSATQINIAIQVVPDRVRPPDA